MLTGSSPPPQKITALNRGGNQDRPKLNPNPDRRGIAKGCADARTDAAAPAVGCGSGRSSTSGELWKVSGHYQGISGHKKVYLTPYRHRTTGRILGVPSTAKMHEDDLGLLSKMCCEDHGKPSLHFKTGKPVRAAPNKPRPDPTLPPRGAPRGAPTSKKRGKQPQCSNSYVSRSGLGRNHDYNQ